MDEFLHRLARHFPLERVEQQKPGLAFCYIPKDRAVTFIRELRDREGYTHLAFITATDYIEQSLFTLTYMLHNYDHKTSLGIHVDIDRNNPEMESMHMLWAQVETYVRELYEMYGIVFPGSPRLGQNFCLEGWDEAPPMRREFDIVEYSERMFSSRPGRKTTDPREYMKQALYPLHVDEETRQ